MKRISILALLLCAFAGLAWAQQEAVPRLFKRAIQHHQPLNTGSDAADGRTMLSRTQEASSHLGKVWELGTYNGGTWTWLGDVNDFGLAVGMGDIGDGHTRTLAVPLFGPGAGQWFDLGRLAQEDETGVEEPLVAISDTGLVVTHSIASNGYVHAVAWTSQTGMVDLGTLTNLGYKAYNSSYAAGVNKLGTLIVGWSGVAQSCLDCAPALPVVWIPSFFWRDGRWNLKWNMQKLDTTGFDDLTYWYVWNVNDSGQIGGIAHNDDFSVYRPILWNPLPNGKSWKIVPFTKTPSFNLSDFFGINDRGELVGDDGATGLAALWKPLNPQRNSYTSTIILPHPEGLSTCYADGINKLGDITGECWGDAGDQAVRWNANDPSFVEILGLPGDASAVWKVNDFRIAEGVYVGGKCTGDLCGIAAQIR
jgi:probable HAF family extracellular repeat protein